MFSDLQPEYKVALEMLSITILFTYLIYHWLIQELFDLESIVDILFQELHTACRTILCGPSTCLVCSEINKTRGEHLLLLPINSCLILIVHKQQTME